MAIEPTKSIWKDGKLIAWQDAQVHVLAHAMHYGTSVFEGIRCYKTTDGRAIFRLEAHIKRLFESAKIYRFSVNHDEQELLEACRLVIVENQLESAYIRPLIYYGFGTLAVLPPEEMTAEVIIAAIRWGAYLGEEGLKNGIDVCVSSWSRMTSASNPVLSKAGGHYLNSQLVASDARRNGYAEAIVVNNGLISEGSAENIFIVRDGVIFTPPLAAAILGGITRDSVMVLARELGFEIREQSLPRDLLYVSDEIFLTGTAAEITPVRSVDQLPVGNGKPGPITQALQSAFLACSMAQHKINGTGWIGSDSRVATTLFELMKSALVDSFYTTTPVYSLAFRPDPPR